jgi:ribosomal protein S18 acetylase RimI-like enzyme
MSISYFKRFRMEIDLNMLPPVPRLPEGYRWVPWDENLLELHADVKFHSFFEEIDAIVFPSLSTRSGCSHLMREISGKPGFQREATWLLAHGETSCGTVQGVRDRNGMGAIQNLGIRPTYRGRGLGTALLLQALHGFVRGGLGRAFLEVTAQNEVAIRLYRRLGFRCRKTIYKAVESDNSLQAACFYEV